MERECSVSGQPFEISEEELAYYASVDVPPPTLSPLERNRRRMMYRNFVNLYHRSCDLTGTPILSAYAADCPVTVYDMPTWWGDRWDAKDYGKMFDFSKPFFDQYAELARMVPRYGISNVNSENCQYSNFTMGSKNCYLVFGCVRDEDCLYGHIVWDSRSCIDCLYISHCELCSNSRDLFRCYDVHYSSESTNCRFSFFLDECVNCEHCFGCTNLQGARYCAFNEQYSETAYRQLINQYFPLTQESIDELSLFVSDASRKHALPAFAGLSCESVVGNHLYESRNIYCGFDLKQCVDSRYCFTGFQLDSCYDLSFTGASARFCYECLTMANSEDCRFCHQVYNSHSVTYGEFCYASHDLFGCAGIRNGEYCILNTPYSRDEYRRLTTKIIAHMKETGEWGEFFPGIHSPFAYNESIASEYMPLTKNEVSQRGLRWREVVGEPARVEATQVAPPCSVLDAGPETLREVYRCEVTGRPFKILSTELKFLEERRLALPRKSPLARHRDRLLRRENRELVSTKCGACGLEIETGRPAEGRTVLCGDCYEQTAEE